MLVIGVLLVGRCVRFVVRCRLLFRVCWLAAIVRCLLFAVVCSLLLVVVCCLLFVVCCSL